jgi:uncharacterized membrane protein YbhN (UPF0104 family)
MRLIKYIQLQLGKRRVQIALATAIILITRGLFTLFFVRYPQYLRSLRHLSLWTVALLIGLYLLMLLVLAAVYGATLALCDKKIPFRENMLLTMYSTLANFFGPLQSGPGVRAIYLKKRHQVRIRDYTMASLIYYGFFALVSAVFLSMGKLNWWQITLMLTVVIVVSSQIIFWYRRADHKRSYSSQLNLNKTNLLMLLATTTAQLFLISLIYFIELHVVNHHVSYRQAVAYAGAANFALFVSLTPGAIGIRESFLVLSRKIHRIPTSAILTANLIDRGTYLIVLGILFFLVLVFHAQQRLKLGGFWQSS